MIESQGKIKLGELKKCASEKEPPMADNFIVRVFTKLAILCDEPRDRSTVRRAVLSACGAECVRC